MLRRLGGFRWVYMSLLHEIIGHVRNGIFRITERDLEFLLHPVVRQRGRVTEVNRCVSHLGVRRQRREHLDDLRYPSCAQVPLR
jgi:hypothetical protein